MRYYVGGEQVNSSQFAVSSCYNVTDATTNATTAGSCISASPYAPMQAYDLPAFAPTVGAQAGVDRVCEQQ
jgi:hypothetical protein